MAFAILTPCQCSVSGFEVRFFSLTRTSSPRRARSTGPGTASLKAQSSASAGASGCSLTRFGPAVSTRKPSSSGSAGAVCAAAFPSERSVAARPVVKVRRVGRTTDTGEGCSNMLMT
jgi:hypothetical protein